VVRAAEYFSSFYATIAWATDWAVASHTEAKLTTVPSVLHRRT
jgi:hypothetical protein